MVARAYTLTSEDCHDLSQEILLQAWRSLPQFEGRASAATWFYRVALHTAMNWQRKDRPRRDHQKPLLEILHPPADQPACDDRLQRQEMVEQLYQAIRRLPKTDAAIVLLSLEELSYQEIADILGISKNLVGVKLNRAKRSLSESMRGDANDT